MTERSQQVKSSRPAEKRPGPVGGARDANRRAKTEALRQAALRLFLERGLEAVSIDDVTRAAGIAKGSFYRYYDDKEALVLGIVAPIARQVREALDLCTAAIDDARSGEALLPAYVELGGRLATALLGEPDVVRLYLQESRGPAAGARRPLVELSREIGARSVVLSAAAHHHGLLRRTDPRVTALAVVGAVERLVYALYSGEDLGDPAEAPGVLIDMVLDGLRASGRAAPR